MREFEVMKILRDIDLTDKANSPAKHLSGGQKRKLSIGIAIIGDPKVFKNCQFLRLRRLVLLFSSIAKRVRYFLKFHIL